MSEPASTSREARESVFLSAVITCFGGSAPTRHRVRNLSPNGACVDQASKLRKGQMVTIHVGLLEEVGATVAWVEGDLAGFAFAHPIKVDAAKSRPKPAHLTAGPTDSTWYASRR